MISSVAYADEERLSDANTASAVGFPRRSWTSWSVFRGRPSRALFTRYPRRSGTSSGGVGGIGRGGSDGGAGRVGPRVLGAASDITLSEHRVPSRTGKA